jgi:hypothetical protein
MHGLDVAVLALGAGCRSNEYVNLHIAQIFILCRLFFTQRGEKQPTKKIKYLAAAG